MSRDTLYCVKGPKNLLEMTWPEVEEALRKTDVVIIPIGSTEQHGLHLPLGSDTMQGDDLAKRVVFKLSKEDITVVAAPSIPFGISEHHMRFPGSITLTTKTLIAVIREVCHSLYRHGFRKFVLLLSHGGNLKTLNLAAQTLATEMRDAIFIVPDWLPVMYSHYKDVLKSERYQDEHHSGEAETARMLASTPKLVELEKAQVYYSKEEDDPYRRKPYPGSVAVATLLKDQKTATPIGSQGNPHIATAETGEKLYEISAEWICDVIKFEFFEK